MNVYDIKLTADESEVLRSFNNVISKGNQVESEVKQLNNVTQREFDKSGREVRKFGNEFHGLNGNVGRAGGAMKGLFALAGRAVPLVGIGLLAKEIGTLGIESEQTKISFETFLGSAEKAKQVIGDLTQFSIVTPFTPEQVTQAGKALLAFGLEQEKLIPTLRSVGDVASGTGKDFNELAIIYGKARTAGVVFSEDINQLTEAGVPIIDELAKSLNVATGDVKKLAEQGKIGFADLEGAFVNMTSEGGRFFNLMEKQSQTTGGRISTLVGDVVELAKALGEEANPAIGNVVDKLDAFVKAIDPQAVIDFFSPIGNKLVPAVQELFTAISELVNSLFGFNDNAEQAAALTEFMRKAFDFFVESISAAVNIVTQIIRGFKDLYENSELLQGIFQGIGDVLSWVIDQWQIFFDDVERATKGTLGLVSDLNKVNNELQAQQKELDAVTAAVVNNKPATEDAAKAQQKMASATKKSTDELKKYREEYRKLVDELESKAVESGLDFLSDFERLEVERNLALEEVEKFEKEVRSAAKKARRTLGVEQEAQIAELFANIKKEYDKKTEELVLSLSNESNSISKAVVDGLTGTSLSAPDLLPNSVDANLKKGLDEKLAKLGYGSGVALVNSIGTGVEEADLKERLDRFLGQFSEEELEFAKEQFGNFAMTIADNWVGAVDIQIAQNERLIEAYDSRISAQQKLVEEERRLSEQGVANNLSAERAKLEQLEAQREAARLKGEELQKKSARRQIIVDTAVQVSSLATAAANIQKGTSSVPFVGIALGIGLFATLLSAFQRFKANANKAVDVPKFKHGGNLADFFSGEVMGQSHSGGGVPAAAAGRPIELEGREFVTNGIDAQDKLGLLHDINRGKYRGVDVEVVPRQLIGSILPGIRKSGQAVEAARQEAHILSIEHAFESALKSHLSEHGDRIVTAINSKPVVYPLPDGYIVEAKEGNKTSRKRVRVRDAA